MMMNAKELREMTNKTIQDRERAIELATISWCESESVQNSLKNNAKKGYNSATFFLGDNQKQGTIAENHFKSYGYDATYAKRILTVKW